MLKGVLDDDSGPQGEESCEDKVRGRVQQHLCLVGSTRINLEVLKSILRLVSVAQKLLLEFN